MTFELSIASRLLLGKKQASEFAFLQTRKRCSSDVIVAVNSSCGNEAEAHQEAHNCKKSFQAKSVDMRKSSLNLKCVLISYLSLTAFSSLTLLGAKDDQAPVVQTMDSAVHRINHYPADKH